MSRIDDHQLLIEQHAAAADQLAGAFFVGDGVDHLIVFQRLGVERADHRQGTS